MATVWPIGVTGCFLLILFLIVASIVLALIPIYLPHHGSDIKPLKTQNQGVYVQYLGRAQSGSNGFITNINQINNQYKSDLGFSGNLINVEKVQVVRNSAASKRRRSVKNFLKRRKRQIIVFEVLFYIRISYPITCRSHSCQSNMIRRIRQRCAEKGSLTLQFLFIDIISGPITFELSFIEFYLTIPSMFINSGRNSSSSSTRLSTSTVASTDSTATATEEILTSSTDSVTSESSTTQSTDQTTEVVASKTSDLIDFTSETSTKSSTTKYSTKEASGTGNLIDFTTVPSTSETTGTTTSNNQCNVDVSDGLQWFSLYNLITLGDLSTNSAVAGQTIICGSLISNDSAYFANGAEQTFPPSTSILELNGAILSGDTIYIIQGSFSYGTDPLHNVTSGGSPDQYFLDGRPIDLSSGFAGAQLNVDYSLSLTCHSMTQDLIALSEAFARLTNTSENNLTLSTADFNTSSLYVNAVDQNGISVFNLDGNTLLNNPLTGEIELIVAENISSNLTLVVINVYGTTINFDQGELVGSWFTSDQTGPSHTVWNFPQATNLTINQIWFGSLLAPYAAVTNSAPISGSTAVASLSATADINYPLIIAPSCI